MDNELGEGGFGLVKSVNGKAVKYFQKLSYLVAEYAALNLVKDCPFIVNPVGIDFGSMSLSMELCETNMRKWLKKQRKWISSRAVSKAVREERTKEFESDCREIMEDVLRGLIYLHDRNLLHSDVKPSNILLIRRNGKIGAVLGDCGFISRKEYARTAQTTAVYRDRYHTQTYAHDIYSLGITFLEMYGEFLTRDTSEMEIMALISRRVPSQYQGLVKKMIGPPTKRPTARQILKELYGYSYNSDFVGINHLWKKGKDLKEYRNVAAKFAKQKGIIRGMKAFNAVSYFLSTQLPSMTPLHFIAASFYICRSTFGCLKIDRKNRVISVEDYLTLGNCNHRQFFNCVQILCESEEFLSILFANSEK